MSERQVLDGRFQVSHPIGMGSFAGVFWGRDLETGQDVALKMLRPDAADDQNLRDRFCREAEIGALVKHPGSTKFLDSGWYQPPQGADRPYIAMELARGLPLDELLSHREGLTPKEVAYVLASVLDALHAAHMQGIVHRDLKPANIIVVADPSTYTAPKPRSKDMAERLGVPCLGDPHWSDLRLLEIKVIDFGLGKLLEIDNRRVSKLTASGILAGTVQYMSPEQCTGTGAIDHRADIYGAAALIHRLITGAPPFSAGTIAEIARHHIQTPLPELPAPWCNHRIAAIYHRGGAKRREERYATAAEMSWEFRTIYDDSLMFASPPDFESPPPVIEPQSGGIGGWFKRLATSRKS